MNRFGGWVWLYTASFQERAVNLSTYLYESITAKPSPESAPAADLNASLPALTDLPFNAPDKDVDFSTTTDCEDLAAFANDLNEFLEQDRALLTDSLTDPTPVSTNTILFTLLGSRILTSRFFKRRF